MQSTFCIKSFKLVQIKIKHLQSSKIIDIYYF